MQNAVSFRDLLKSYIDTLKTFYKKDRVLAFIIASLFIFSLLTLSPAGIVISFWMFAVMPFKNFPKSKETLLTRVFYSSLVLFLVWVSVIFNPYSKFLIIAFNVAFVVFIYFFYLYIQKKESENREFSLR